MDVLDASVGLKWVLAEPDSDKARKLRDESHSCRAGYYRPTWIGSEDGR